MDDNNEQKRRPGRKTAVISRSRGVMSEKQMLENGAKSDRNGWSEPRRATVRWLEVIFGLVLLTLWCIRHPAQS